MRRKGGTTRKTKPKRNLAQPVPTPMHTRAEAAGYVKVSLSQFDVMHRLGKGPTPTYIGARRNYTKENLDAWIHKLTRGTEGA